MLSISKLRTEYLENPIGIDAANPRLSWILKSSRQNVMQDSYRVLAASDPGFSDILHRFTFLRSICARWYTIIIRNNY